MNDQHARGTTTQIAWKKSSHSSGSGACVEVRKDRDSVAFRDSKNLSLPPVEVAASAWEAFLQLAADRLI